jgi:hypothetical protein
MADNRRPVVGVVITATDAAGNRSTPKTTHFRIARD